MIIKSRYNVGSFTGIGAKDTKISLYTYHKLMDKSEIIYDRRKLVMSSIQAFSFLQ